MGRIRVILADDHTLVRAGFSKLLQALPDVEVIGEAENGRDALRLIEQHRPDIVLMDIAMPGLNGLDAAERITETYDNISVIILSMHMNEEYVLRALRAGAAGYLLKDAGPTELKFAIQAVARGETYLSPAVSRQVTEYVRRVGDESASLDRLTPRQREVLQLIAEGKTNRQIAYTLDISVKTVETHRADLMKRLNIHDIAGLVRYAIKTGLVRVEE